MRHVYNSRRGQSMSALLLLCLFLFTQCAPKLAMQDGQRVEELGVCLLFGPNVPVEFQEKFEESLDQYMVKFNSQPHAFKLTECKDNSSLQINVEDVKYTTPGQRATGFIVSALGLVALPAVLASSGASFVAAFYYIPYNQTLATAAFSKDIAHPTLGAMPKVYNTGGLFGSDAFQREKHAKKFELHLNMLFREIETSYKASSKRKAKYVADIKTSEPEVTATN